VKKISLILVAFTLLLTGCGNQQEKMEIITDQYTEKGVEVKFPQLSNMTDETKEQRLNKLIKDEALRIIAYYDQNFTNRVIEVEYKVTYQSEDVLSVQYFGYFSAEDVAHPTNIFYTSNIDLQKEKVLVLKDLIEVNQDLVTLFRNGQYVPLDSGLNLENEGLYNIMMERFTDEELLTYFQNADHLDESNISNVYSYLKEDTLGISIGIPHALGDHMEVEMKVEGIANRIK